LRQSYFSMYPGVWRHGDWIRITPRGGAVIYGRSDSTINRQGVRMGTSEIYRAAGAGGGGGGGPGGGGRRGGGGGARGGGCAAWGAGGVRGGALRAKHGRAGSPRRIREDCSPRHVPNEIVQIAEVPRTLSGKVLEVPVKRILMGAAPDEAASVDSLANPQALDYFVRLAGQLRG